MTIQKERLLSVHSNITDTSGRRIYWDEQEGETIPNKISGREEFETNQQAFIEFIENAPEVESLIAYMRKGIAKEKLNPRDLQQFGRGLYALPLYLTLRKNNPIPENEIPPPVIDAAISETELRLWLNI